MIKIKYVFKKVLEIISVLFFFTFWNAKCISNYIYSRHFRIFMIYRIFFSNSWKYSLYSILHFFTQWLQWFNLVKRFPKMWDPGSCLLQSLVHIIAFLKMKPLFITCQFSKPVNRNKCVIHNAAQSWVYHSSQTEGPSEGRTKAPLRRHVTN